MQSLPFRLLVGNELDLQDAVRTEWHNWQPPGVVEENECQPLWKSNPQVTNVSSPQELGLILLSAQPPTVKCLRLKAELARAPAQVVIFAALPPRHGATNTLNSLDTVSRYLSADWKQCCEPLVWEASSQRLDTSRNFDSRIVYLDVAKCSFIKLIFHVSFKGTNNRSQQVALENIELLGSTEDSLIAQCPQTDKHDEDRVNNWSTCSVIHRPVLLPFANAYDELQAVLLDAGVPMDLVAQVADISRRDADILRPYQQNGEIIPESRSKPAAITGEGTAISHNRANEEKDSTSPFDIALQQCIKQSARERSMLEEVLATKISNHTDEVTSWQSPTVPFPDSANSKAITLYTFGAFFTQCVLCGGADIQATCIQLVERTTPLLKNLIGATCAFEGVIALIVLGVRAAKTPQVFQTAIHLAHTVFLTESTCMKKASDLVEPERSSKISPALNLIEEVACANWSYGLRVILEWALASSFCWSISHNEKPTSSKNRVGQLSKAPPSVDRGFLQFIRLLVDQDLTCTIFFDELLDLSSAGNDAGLSVARNRLRLLRLILRNDIIRCHVSTKVKTNIRSFCTDLTRSKSPSQNDEMTLKYDDENILARLASECIAKIDLPGESGNNHSSVLTSVRRQLEVSNNVKCHYSHHYPHTALFVQDALSVAGVAAFTSQLQRYYSSQPRPNGLYRHSFVRASHIDSKDDGLPDICESFQKGNIVFQGQVVARTPPLTTFHDEIQRNTAPFVFDIGGKLNTRLSPLPAGNQEIVSSFAAFKGTIKRRNDRSNKISPEQQIPDLSITITTSTSKQPASTVAISTRNTLASESRRVMSPNKEPLSIPQVVVANHIPATPHEAIAVRTQPLETTPPVMSPTPVVIDQQPLSPEGTKPLINTIEPAHRNIGPKQRATTKKKNKRKTDSKDQDHCVLQ